MKTIALSQGKVALVDDVDYEWLNQWKWTASRNHRTWYAMRRGPRPAREHITMHREIASKAGFPEVDHRDLDGLNNQRENLRPCSKSQQQGNRPKGHGCYSSRHKGVYWDSARSVWRARIEFKGKQHHLGRFAEESGAAAAYAAAACEFFGDFARV